MCFQYLIVPAQKQICSATQRSPEPDMDEYKFTCEPLANSESIVAGPHYRFTIINDKVIRYEWSEDGVFEDRASTFAINRKFPKPEFLVEDKENQLEISTSSW